MIANQEVAVGVCVSAETANVKLLKPAINRRQKSSGSVGCPRGSLPSCFTTVAVSVDIDTHSAQPIECEALPPSYCCVRVLVSVRPYLVVKPF